MEERNVVLDPPVPMYCDGSKLPILAIDLPVVYEDEGYEEMGETTRHTRTIQILLAGLTAHLRAQPQYRVYSDLNLLYHPIKRRAYISPDVMVAIPFHSAPDNLDSYRIGEDGPKPVLTAEVLSQRTAQQGDLTTKPRILSEIAIEEYLLLDPEGRLMPERLLLRRLQPDGSWLELQDADGGITSALGFRVIIDSDGNIRVVDAATGHKYLRPDEAELADEARQKAEKEEALAELARKQAEEDRRREEAAREKAEKEKQQADERVRQLEAEIARLKTPPQEPA